MGIFNLQQLFGVDNIRIARWISSLLFLVCFISFSNNVVAQVTFESLTASPATIQCAGGQTTITATASAPTGIQYSIDGVTYQSDNTFTVSAAGSYTVTAQEVGVPANVATQLINIPANLLSATVAGTSYICTDGTGTFTVSVSGGVTPYSVTVGATTLTDEPFTFSNLDAGTYSISVTDNCPTQATVTKPFTVALDNVGPSCTNPSALFIDAADYVSITPVVDTVIRNDYAAHGGSLDVQTFTFPNSGNYIDPKFKLIATSSGTGWTDNDIIKVEVSYDNGTTWGSTPVVQAVHGGVPVSDWISLNNSKLDIQMRLTRVSENTSNTYTVEHLYVGGTNRAKTIVSSEPYDCTDNYSTSYSKTFSDGAVDWRCTTAGALEFSFYRTWEVKDDCENSSTESYSQRISVGTAPTFVTIPGSVTYDFCNNSNVTIDPPTVSDNCAEASNLVLEWMVFDVDGNPVSLQWYTYPSVKTYNFTPAAEGQEFRIGWRVTDEAGISTVLDASTTTHRIIFKPEISIALVTPVSPYHVCEGSDATFYIRATGGTGSYTINSITPAPVESLPLSVSEGTDATFSYNSTNQIAAGASIIVTYVDVDNGSVTGGCSSPSGSITFYSGVDGYSVHQKITTGAISRSDP